jgi:uncharacterized membrane protein YidH (DUF202 family)
MQETSRIPPSDRRAAFLSSADLVAEHAQSYRVPEGNHLLGNRKVTDHLANERTFLAWIRTALAVITFGSALGRLRLWGQNSRPRNMPPTLLQRNKVLQRAVTKTIAMKLFLVAMARVLSNLPPGCRNHLEHTSV